MKVLFISSGNKGISPIIKAQGESLRKAGLQIEYAPIVGKGFLGYLKNIPKMRRMIKEVKPDIIHAHYSLCGFVAALANISLSKKNRKPLVTSLMGGIAKGGIWLTSIKLFNRCFWDVTITKSEEMKRCLSIESALVIPNGVDTDVFIELAQDRCRAKLGWALNNKYILFGANPAREDKQFPLAKVAFSFLTTCNLHLKTLGEVPHLDIPIYLNASDTLLLTSRSEGSPNIIKEAMACNIPIVCPDVGDVKWLLDGIDGAYICSHQPEDIAQNLELSLEFVERTKARQRLVDLGLDAAKVAERIIQIYEKLLPDNKRDS